MIDTCSHGFPIGACLVTNCEDEGLAEMELPPVHNVGRNLADIPHIPLDSYSVNEWTPERDGLGKTTEVHIIFDVREPPFAFVMALKSPRAVNELIGILARHRNSVWPDSKDKK